ncbi:MAG: PilT/PilU family type 4a pilus ATPase, partial [Lachnospiraceae bacterium]|nr:PilT/PilU family type 4a pilus ATPase [Lachnospiraceae bacterium]
TGPTGSGKTTTLAAHIQQVNHNRSCHVLTLEDPIEYLYRHDRSLVDQREIGLDSRSFATALRAALREDPDVILVGEMRDLETIATAITAAETGHLVFSSLHTNDAASTINRIIDVFPENQKDQIRTQLSMVTESVISQRLLPRADGKGRTACFEIMHCTPAIRSLIRENKIHQIPGIIQTSSRAGMITMDEALFQAVCEGRISRTTALEYAADISALDLRFGGGDAVTERRFSW